MEIMKRLEGTLALVLGCALAYAAPALAQQSEGTAVESQAPGVDVQKPSIDPPIVVPVGKSRVIHFDRAFSQILVGSKDIVHVVTLSHNAISILGEKRGTTNLTLTGGRRTAPSVVSVVVTGDVDGLEHDLAEFIPGANIRVAPAGDGLILDGTVANAGDLNKAVEIASHYARGNIVNFLRVVQSQQVMLSVKFAEVTRSAIQDLGVTVLNGNAASDGLLVPDLTKLAQVTEFGTYGGLLTDSSSYELRAKLQAMETRGLVHTLAEPNLVAMSGQPASFLAGGEFPIPVVQSTTGTVPVTTIQYKDFGVGLSFTPSVLSDNVVNLNLKAEVSAIDSSASITTSGVSVPGFKVRRTKTTVELRDGQTFAIAGLIQDDFQDSLDALPGLGDIPILGALFRSAAFRHDQSELVVFITVHLVRPVAPGTLQVPTDSVQPPTISDLDAFGKTEGPPKAPPPPAPAGGPTALKSEGYVLP